MISVQDILKKNYQQQRLAHFYHLKNGQSLSHEQIQHWLNDFFSSINVKNYQSHSDLLIIDQQSEGNQYSVNDLNELYRFVEYRPLSLSTKFIIFLNAAKLSLVVSNKLLKVLEEPSPYTTILLFNPSGVELLPTINSRAVNLSLNMPPSQEYQQLAQEIQTEIQNGLTLNQFIDKYKKTQDIDTHLLKGLLQNSAERSDQLIDLAKHLDEAKTYHNSISHRLTRLYQFIALQN